MRKIFTLLLLILATPIQADPLDAARAPGAILLMRHATAPGSGDPSGFRLGECATQRNLSEQGRAEARAAGQRLRDASIRFAHILTSEWCRARETATLMDLGPVTRFAPANSFFGIRGDEARQSADLLDHLRRLPSQDRVLIVTHQVNITALTGIVPRSGEAVVVRLSGAGVQVVDRLPPP